ncbi:MAG: ATP-binding cassette domain-containing protein [Gemmatimonadales bacterium]
MSLDDCIPTPLMLAAEGVSKRYAGVVALDDVSVSVPGGECLALVGESGAGKSTLLRCFNRLVDPDAGRVTIGGADVRELDPIALRRRTGYVAQEGGLLPHWHVARNVSLVPWLLGDSAAGERAAEALALVGLDPARFGARRPSQLSGGQRQRVALARALAARPPVVLLDEPFGALDAITRGELREAFAELRARVAFTCVLVTHDLHEAIALATRIAVLRDGRVEQDATPAAMVSVPATAYVAKLLERAGVL